MNLQTNTGKEYFYNKEYKKALEIFKKEKDYYSCGLCCLLLKKLLAARCYWKKDRSSRASSWGLAFLDLIQLKQPTRRVSFFSVRAYLEIYLNLLIQNNLTEWAQNVVSMCDVLYQYNPESYKFIARVLFANGYFNLSITFCKKSLELFYSDPEAFLILSQCHFLLGDLGESLDCVNRVNNMVKDYYPALLFEKIVRQEIAKKHAGL
ncbi:MAG: hypothetical protein IJW73_01885 [Candidatus Gastranaerophilales bacterium]|nr:hypothetical protein [Candidatus Gastranaerophilales bacterium]